MKSPLDNPAWAALTTRDARFAEGTADARRFLADVAPLAGVPTVAPRSGEALASLLAPDEMLSLFVTGSCVLGPALTVVATLPLVRMVQPHDATGDGELVAHRELGVDDVAAMLSLATLARPGPFRSRTHELGTYLGIERDGRLVAMAGERMALPGHVEMSAVCTHPGYVGQGLAQGLMRALGRRMRARGDTPFLHVRADNARALALYGHLGFIETARVDFVTVRRA